MRLLTVGHGTADREQFSALLRGAGVEVLADVRRFPGSRRNDDTRKEALEQWLPSEGIDYVWLEDLGGRRRRTAGEPETDQWWRVAQFRAYAAYTRTGEFTAALRLLRGTAEERTTAIMCSESVWWRCHRRIVADVLMMLHGFEVQHLMPDGRLTPHEPSAGARVCGGAVYWDVQD
ncbi:Protein of unknown function, DUF488 [Arthrobacter subterraneus]|uniref:DUF488 domain-containing protein n=1 Tax=Arthrobacter subterraneus TaxID=335973 RepID=A0A1G8H5G0_9MICC|nr:DUF488 domain-containing protein [Arthrobacter subterraneus]SDI01855.1 Protein of unknown function, DUF488 [Arthrobacter subterraneus]